MGVARENLRGGERNSQNLRSGEGFCKKAKGLERGLGRSLSKIFDFNALLCVFTSFFINIFNL